MGASDHPGLMHPKGPPRRFFKGRAAREETKVKARVRGEIMMRDRNRCRLAWYGEAQWAMGVCRGPVEWAHWGPYRRSKTVGMAPAARHCRQGGLAMCDRHHDDYDEGRMAVEALTSRECDGPLRFERDGRVWIEDELK